MRMPNLVEELCAKPKQLGLLVGSLLSALITNWDSTEPRQKLLQDIIARVPIADIAEAATTQILQAFQTASEEALPGLQHAIRCTPSYMIILCNWGTELFMQAAQTNANSPSALTAAPLFCEAHAF